MRNFFRHVCIFLSTPNLTFPKDKEGGVKKVKEILSFETDRFYLPKKKNLGQLFAFKGSKKQEPISLTMQKTLISEIPNTELRRNID